MLGTLIGDIVGSIYEFNPIKSKDFNIYDERMHMTDDSLLTLAVAKVLINNYPFDYSKECLDKIKKDLIKEFAKTWKNHPDAGWGSNFEWWCEQVYLKGYAKPYHSCGNGAGMRISPVGWLANSEEELKILSKTVTEITHDNQEGLKGAEAVAMAIFMALHGASKEQIKKRMIDDYYPEIGKLVFGDLIDNYEYSELCEESVPQAIYCFLISNSLEDAIRNCIAIGGDCDTTGAMAGAIAEAYYQRDSLSTLEKIYFDIKIDKQYRPLINRFYDLLSH